MNDRLKNMGHTLESWMRVESPYQDTSAAEKGHQTVQMPYYRLTMQPTDTDTVTEQAAGHWCISILEERGEDAPPEWLSILYDPAKVFGEDTTLMRPDRLYSHSIQEILQEPQYGQGKTPSAFAALENITLGVGESVTLTTFFGKADHLLDVPVIARRLLQPGFALFKATRANALAEQITSSVESETAHPIWDGHAQQMFLDNSLRGGIPQILGEDEDSKIRCTDEDDRLKVFHLFSRVHGDLERDYNDFEIAPTFFSNVSARADDRLLGWVDIWIPVRLRDLCLAHTFCFYEWFASDAGSGQFSRCDSKPTERCLFQSTHWFFQCPNVLIVHSSRWIRTIGRGCGIAKNRGPRGL